MSLSIKESLLSTYQAIPNDPNNTAYRNQRSIFLEKVGTAYKDLCHEVSNLNSDKFLHEAETIINGTNFQNFPGSVQRLTPLAKDCIDAYGILCATMQQQKDEKTLKDSIIYFVIFHQSFLNQYIPEFQEVFKHTKSCVKISHPNSIKAFSNTIKALKSKEFDLKISENDPSLFTEIPYQTIVRFFASEEDKIPELFNENKLKDLKSDFCSLSKEEQTSIRTAKPLESAKALYKKIFQIVLDAQRGQNALFFNLIMNVVLQ